MAGVRKEVRGGTAKLTLNAGITAASSSMLVNGSVTGWPTGALWMFEAIIDRGEPTEEQVLCSTLTGSGPATIAISQRGWNGTTAVDHDPNATVEHFVGADTIEDILDHIYDTTRHDHTQYTKRDGTIAFTGVSAIAATPVAVGTSNAPGTAVTLARSDHVHDIGSLAINDLGLFASGIPIPVGLISDFVGTSAPTGWLLCDGSAVSRSTYAALFAVVGTTFGVGDGSTTFNLPDLRGRVGVGLDNMGGTDAGRLAVANTLGLTGGAETHTLSTTEIPAHLHAISFNTGAQSADHTHTYSGTTSSDGAHTHQPNFGQFIQTAASVWWLAASGLQTVTGADNTASTGAHTHSYSGTTSGVSAGHTHAVSGNTGNTGGAGAHNNMPPYLLLNKIIKT